MQIVLDSWPFIQWLFKITVALNQGTYPGFGHGSTSALGNLLVNWLQVHCSSPPIHLLPSCPTDSLQTLGLLATPEITFVKESQPIHSYKVWRSHSTVLQLGAISKQPQSIVVTPNVVPASRNTSHDLCIERLCSGSAAPWRRTIEKVRGLGYSIMGVREKGVGPSRMENRPKARGIQCREEAEHGMPQGVRKALGGPEQVMCELRSCYSAGLGLPGSPPSLRYPMLHLMTTTGRAGIVVIKQGSHMGSLLNDTNTYDHNRQGLSQL